VSKVLLLGGTGAIGVYLREILAQNGHEVYVTSRFAQAELGVGGIRFLQGNAHDLSFVERVLREVGPDAIVDFMTYASEEFALRYETFLRGTQHYLFLSSYRVFNDDKRITERSPRLLDTVQDERYLKTDEYALCKARSENCLRQSALGNWTIIRPGITYSRRRFQLGCLEANTLCFRSLAGLPVIMPSLMRGKETTLTWGRDVAMMISKLLLNQAAYSEDFNCATAEHHTWDFVADIYRRELGADIRDCSVEDYIKVIGNGAQVKYDRLFDRIIDNSKVLDATGLKQLDFKPLEEGLVNELEDFKSNPVYQYPDVVLNARMDRLLGTRISLKGFPLGMKLSYWGCQNRIVGFGLRAARRLKRMV
jgi:nucleoside-diphosphate-sugar epimerase